MKNEHEIEIVIAGKEWSSILNTVFLKKQKDIKVDGFRKGSIPKDVYIKKFGIEALYPDAVDTAVSEAYKRALNDSKLIPVVEPQIDITKIDEHSVTFKFVFITKPEVKLGKYKDLKVKKAAISVSKEELANEVNNLKTKLADIVVKEGGKVEEGNTAVLDFVGFVDGKELEGGSGTDFPLEIGSNTFIPGFENGIIGMKVNESKELDLTFPEDYTADLKGKKVKFKVTVKEIKERVYPEVNEEFYKDLGYDDIKTEEEFEREVESSIKLRKEADGEDAYIEECLSVAADAMKVELNEEIISEEVHRMIHQFEEQLKMQGMNIEQYMEYTKMTHEDLHKNMTPEALKRVKYRYLIEGVAEKENIEVSDKEAKDEAKKTAKQYSMETEEFLKTIGGLEMMKYDIKMRKAIEIIKG